jgi:hypothetical protein
MIVAAHVLEKQRNFIGRERVFRMERNSTISDPCAVDIPPKFPNSLTGSVSQKRCSGSISARVIFACFACLQLAAAIVLLPK